MPPATVRLDLSTGAQDAAVMSAIMIILGPTGKDAEEVELREKGLARRSRLAHRGRTTVIARTSINSWKRCERCKEMSDDYSGSPARR